MWFIPKEVPEQVFLPRTPEIKGVYVERPRYKEEFSQKIRTPWKHLYLFWISWAGKSFLYKKELNSNFIVISAWELRNKDIEILILEKLQESIYESTTQSTKKWSEYGAGWALTAKWILWHEKSENILWWKDRLKEVLNISNENNKKFWIIENIEQVDSNKSVIIKIIELAKKLSDDSNYSTNIKLILVSTSKWKRNFWNTLQQEYSDTKPFKSVLGELEVWRMENSEAQKYISEWFINRCGFSLTQDIIDEIIRLTDRIPHELAQLCLQIALDAQYKWVWIIDLNLVKEWSERWIIDNFSTDLNEINSLKNANNTTIKLRDKVLYVLASIEEYSFRTSLIVTKIKQIFDVNSEMSAVSQALEFLTRNQLLERDDTTNTSWVQYRFCEPKQKLVLRFLLEKGDDWIIKFNQFTDNQIGL